MTIPGTINLLDVAVRRQPGPGRRHGGHRVEHLQPQRDRGRQLPHAHRAGYLQPDNPQILGSTLVTNEQYPVNEAGAKTDVVALGNGDFAVSDNDTNGSPSLLVVDPSNPENIIVGRPQVPTGVHGITVSGTTLYATTSSGLSIYQIGQLSAIR